MEKMNGNTLDIVAENVCELKKLFPEAFTEGKINFDVLKEVLGSFVDDRDERYSFTWNGKRKARMIAQTPSTGTLRPCKEESVDWDTTQNIFIEGDNLEVLKLLQKSYHKKVKMIYIDPPYNTGKDFVYKDNFKDNIRNYKKITGQVDGEGRNLSNNPETSGRYHTDWLNMMYPRLQLARNLLKDDGVIFISIDDNEVANLRKICDEIYGEENFLGVFQWRRRQRADNRNQSRVSPDHEYIVAYSKTENIALKGTEVDLGKYKNPDNDPRGPWASIDLSGLATATQRPNLHYDIVDPDTGISYPPNPSRGWSKSKENVLKMIEEGRILFPKSPTGRPREKKFVNDLNSTVTGFSTCLDSKHVGYTTNGTREVTSLIGGKYFDFPKPTDLLKTLIDQSTEKADIIFDFFAGSATIADAVLQHNVEDKGTRRFIVAQLPEIIEEKSESYKAGYKTIAEISKERIRRVAAKIKQENPKYDGDLGFKVFKLDSTNIKPWEVDFDLDEEKLEAFVENIKADRCEEDVLYEVLLKYGLDLTLPIAEHTIDGQKVFDIGMGSLIVCLSDTISLEEVEGIAKLKDEFNPEIMRVVFKDSGFKDDVVKTNAVQILKQAGIVDIRSL